MAFVCEEIKKLLTYLLLLEVLWILTLDATRSTLAELYILSEYSYLLMHV